MYPPPYPRAATYASGFARTNVEDGGNGEVPRFGCHRLATVAMGVKVANAC